VARHVGILSILAVEQLPYSWHLPPTYDYVASHEDLKIIGWLRCAPTLYLLYLLWFFPMRSSLRWADGRMHVCHPSVAWKVNVMMLSQIAHLVDEL
jgi:hypothetical protein